MRTIYSYKLNSSQFRKI
ncbi:hypothetical protein B4U80_09928 [Leptotrombidium deliense]|uniref:Uncharacterized protein n=1 Tax=Leptotrombidium deliense TaxID=299467 RepID=A0A443SJT2_9ACAR|nr:hypothetical protein B4U80_09928 [Leptotrombidium deliense]